MWCLERNIHITSQYLPGYQNTVADAESRVVTNRTDCSWKLNPAIFANINQLLGPLEVNLCICNLSFNSMPTLLQLAARSLCRNHRCLQIWTHLEGLCQSSMEFDMQNNISGSISTGQDCPASSSLENTTMVSNSPVHTDRLPQNHHSSSGNNNQSASSSNVTTASRMAYLRKRYRDQQLSEEATDLMLNSWRSKTNKFKVE